MAELASMLMRFSAKLEELRSFLGVRDEDSDFGSIHSSLRLDSSDDENEAGRRRKEGQELDDVVVRLGFLKN